MSVIEPPDFEWFRKLFLTRYAEAQRSTVIAPWYSIRTLLVAYDALLSLQNFDVVERAFVYSWIDRINKRIAQLNVINERTDCSRLL